MAISSPLNPGVIAPEKKITPQKVQNFISGGSPLGSTVVASAANKIVGFQRGAAGVAPQAPDLGSIIKTLSSNILTNVENRIQSINQNVNQFVTQKISDLGDRFRERVQKIDAATPNKILENFLGLYRNAIDYIRFFANPANVRNLANNLESLQKVFAETFDVATKIRKTIIRIIDQLSSLPTANAGGSGLSLDVAVPGGGLKKSAPRGLMRAMRRRPGMMLGGAAALGAGATMATSALAKVGQDVEGVPTEMGGGLSGPMLDKFNEILDRFSKAINSLASGKPQQKQSTSSSGSSTASKPPQTPSPGGAPGGTPGGALVSGEGTQEQQALLKTLRFAEGTEKSYGTISGGDVVPELEQGKLTVQEVIDLAQTSKLPQRFGGRTVDHKWSGATGAYQFMPDTLRGLVSQGALKSDELFTNQLQDKAALQLAANRGVTADFLKAQGGFTQAVSDKLAPEWASLPYSPKGGKSYYGQGYKPYATLKSKYEGFLGQPTQTPQATAQAAPSQQPGVVAASTQQQTQQQVAQQVSQPVIPVSSAPQVSVVPIGGQQGSQQPVVAGGGGGGGGKKPVPFLPAGNTDNFLTLYSRIVYNIVDG